MVVDEVDVPPDVEPAVPPVAVVPEVVEAVGALDVVLVEVPGWPGSGVELGPVRESLLHAPRASRMAGMAAVRGWRMEVSFDGGAGGVPAGRASSAAGLSRGDP
jgi:hypothetical protein